MDMKPEDDRKALRRASKGLIALALSGFLAGCASQPAYQGAVAETLERASSRGVPEATAVTAMPGGSLEAIERPLEPVIVRGTGGVLAPPVTPVAPVVQQGDTVTLEFSQAPLGEVVQALLGDLLKLSFSIEQMPEGTVSLRTGAPIPRDAVLPIVESMLQSNGAALLRDGQGIYRIASQTGLRQNSANLYRTEALPPGYGLVVVPLRFIGAAEMAQILQPVASPDAIVRVDAVRNLLILAGSRAQHEGWLEIVRSFDVDFLKGMSLGIFPLEHAAIDDVFDTVSAMLGSAAAAGEGSAVTASAVRLFPIKRLNSLVVVSPRAEHLDTVRAWVQRLDQPALNDLEPRLYVYPVQNGSASHLAELLSSLYGGEGAASGSRRSADSGVAPGLRPASLSAAAPVASSTSSAGAGAGGSGVGTAAAAMPETGTGEGLTTSVHLGDQVKVVADERNNALLILAPRRDYRKIEAALRQLDLAPTQILIEASIIEVSLTGDLKYGLEWTFSGRLGGGRSGSGMLNLNESNPIGPAQPGFSYTITGSGGDIRAVLNALAQRSLLRVLSNPSLLVQDNHTATIHVGDQRPVKSGETISTGGNVSTSITYRDTGVMLSVTPSANAGRLVSMNIHQTVTDVGNIDEASGQRSFLQREIKSRVSVRSGETVVMGGLMRESATGGRSGVPLLHDLPVVGNLFGSTSEETRRTELLVLITPRVISNEAELRAVSDEIRGRMRAGQLRTSGSLAPVSQ